MTRLIRDKVFFFILLNLEPPEVDFICHFGTKLQCLLVKYYNIRNRGGVHEGHDEFLYSSGNTLVTGHD
jgi:hypothetical protein